MPHHAGGRPAVLFDIDGSALVDNLGLQVVLATSAPEDELALLRSALDCDEVISAVTSSGDVEASSRAGVPCIVVHSGGVPRSELENAGAATVFEDAQSLLDHLGETPIAQLR